MSEITIIATLIQMLANARDRNYRPVRWQMTGYFYAMLNYELRMGSEKFMEYMSNELFGLPIEIVGHNRASVALVSDDPTPGGDA